MIWHITGSTIFKLFYWSQQSFVVANSGNPTWKGCCNSNKPLNKAAVVVQPCMEWIPIQKTFYPNIFYKLFKIYTNISLIWDQTPFFLLQPPFPIDSDSHILSLSLLGWESFEFRNHWASAGVYADLLVFANSDMMNLPVRYIFLYFKKICQVTD